MKFAVAELVVNRKKVHGILFVSDSKIIWKSNEKLGEEIKISKKDVKEVKKDKNKTIIVADKSYEFLLSENIV